MRAGAILEAQERLILRRDTHIDDLAYKLREERVRRVIEPILAGAGQQAWSEEDLAYVRDLGLITQDVGGRPRIANPVYAEVVPRHLNYAVQAGLPQEMAWYVDAAGNLDRDLGLRYRKSLTAVDLANLTDAVDTKGVATNDLRSFHRASAFDEAYGAVL